METLEEKIARVLKDRIELAPYDPAWPRMFELEKAHLLECLPHGIITRIEHYGSTSIPGLTAKPVVDMLVEVTDLERTRNEIAPLLEAQGYDYFWKPTDEEGDPYYAWFIKRNSCGERTHHIHMVESHFRHWEGLAFRDYLIAHPEAADEYRKLKEQLSKEHAEDRIAYTYGKTEFVNKILSLVAKTSD